MTIDLKNLWPTILRGARIAYSLDNPASFGRTFEDWLGGTVAVTRATGRSEIADHLELLCGRAIKGESRVPLDQQSAEDQEAVATAHQALQAWCELEHMAALAQERAAA